MARRAVAGGLLLAVLAGAALVLQGDHGESPEASIGGRVELSLGPSADYDYRPPEPGSYRLPPLAPAADGAVLGPGGGKQGLRALMAGRITVLAFIYTRCRDPKGCPLSMGLLYDLAFVAEQDPLIGENLKLIAMSFDPEHDTPEVMAEYAGENAEILFLTTAGQAELQPILAAYGQPVGDKADAGDPLGPYRHLLRVYLVDRGLRIRNIYSLGLLDPRLVIGDVRTLLLEQGGGVGP